MIEILCEGGDRKAWRGVGFSPAFQCTAFATFTVGMSVLFGAGRMGCGPIPAENGSFAFSPHAASETAAASNKMILKYRISVLVRNCSDPNRKRSLAGNVP